MRLIVTTLAVAFSCLSIAIAIGRHAASCYVVASPMNTGMIDSTDETSGHKDKIPPCPLKMGTCDPIPK